MISDERYEDFVLQRAKPAEDIGKSNFCSHVQHMLMGLTTELGELFDAFKRHLIYDQPLDMDNVTEELGDLEYYLAGLRGHLRAAGGPTRADIPKFNMAKLTERYPERYSDFLAQERRDKKVS